MIQLLTRHTSGAGYGGGTSYMSLLGGMNGLGWEESIVFGANLAQTLCPIAGTFSLFAASSPDSHASAVLTVLKNGGATAMTVTLGTDVAGPVTDVTHTVTVVPGDVISVKLVTSVTAFPGYDLALSIQFETASANQSFYGISPFASASGVTNGNGWLGGAYCQGFWQSIISGSLPALSTTYSIGSLTGAVTELHLRSYIGALGSAVWTGYLRHNGVIQDGSGGTVDTSVVLSGATTYAASTFSVPTSPGDHVEVYLVVSGDNSPAAVAGIAVATVVTAATEGQFQIDGGNNNALSQSAVGWAWPTCFQLPVDEAHASVPIPTLGLRVLGLYVELTNAPDTGPGTQSYIITTRKNGADTAATLTLSDATTSASILTPVSYVVGDTIDLQITPVNTPAATGLYWGLLLISAAALPPVYTTTDRVIRRLRRAPHVAANGLRTFHHRFLLDLQPGLGIPGAVPGQNPQVMLRWSNDGGETWSSEHFMGAGELGTYFTRVQAWRLGQSRDRIYEVVVSDPVAWALVGAFLDLDAGTS